MNRTMVIICSVAAATVAILAVMLVYQRNANTRLREARPEELGLRQAPLEEALWNPGVEDGLEPWGWPGGGWTISTTTNHPHSGLQAAIASDRTEVWQGIGQSLLGRIQPGWAYHCSAWVRIENAPKADVTIHVTEVDDDNIGTMRHSFLGSRTVAENQWTEIHGTYVLSDLPGRLTTLFFCVGGPPPGVNLLVDDVSVKAMPDPVPSRPARSGRER